MFFGDWFLLLENLSERRGDGRVEFHTLAGDGMPETKHAGMEAEAVDGIVAIAVFRVAADGMAHIGGMDANLVFPPRFELILHERMFGRAVEHVEMGDGVFSTVIDGRRIGDVGLVVLQPVGNRTLVFGHFATDDGHIAAVIDDFVPIMLENLLGFHVLRINHQAARVAVEAMNDVGTAFLTGFLEIVVEHALHVERLVAGGHRKDANVFLDDDKPAILIDEFHVAALELVVFLRLADSDFHAFLQRKIELRDAFSIDFDAASLQRGLDFRARTLDVGNQPFQKRCLVVDDIMVVAGFI